MTNNILNVVPVPVQPPPDGRKSRPLRPCRYSSLYKMADVLELENAEEFDVDAMDEGISRLKVPV